MTKLQEALKHRNGLAAKREDACREMLAARARMFDATTMYNRAVEASVEAEATVLRLQYLGKRA